MYIFIQVVIGLLHAGGLPAATVTSFWAPSSRCRSRRGLCTTGSVGRKSASMLRCLPRSRWVISRTRTRDAPKGRPPFGWRGGVRIACAEREIGLEEARGLCLDRDAWRSMTDRIVWLIKHEQCHAFNAVGRGIGHLWQDFAGSSGVLWGVPGVTRPYEDRD